MNQTDWYGNTPSSPETQLVPNSLRAFRCWGIGGGTSPDKSRLVACAHAYMWKPGVNKAGCAGMFQRRAVQHDSPSTSCSCGFYAQYTGDVLDYQHHGLEGSIQAHGLTILGTKGIRTQFAQVESLYAFPGKFSSWPHSETMIIEIANYYGVPVFSNRAEWLEAFPAQDVSAIAPPSRIKPHGVEIEDCGAPNDKFAHRVTVWMNDGSRETYPRCKYKVVVVDNLDREVSVEFSNEEGVNLTLRNVQVQVNRISRDDLWGWDRGVTTMSWHKTGKSITYNPPGRLPAYWLNGNNQYSPIWRAW